MQSIKQTEWYKNTAQQKWVKREKANKDFHFTRLLLISLIPTGTSPEFSFTWETKHMLDIRVFSISKTYGIKEIVHP